MHINKTTNTDYKEDQRILHISVWGPAIRVIYPVDQNVFIFVLLSICIVCLSYTAQNWSKKVVFQSITIIIDIFWLPISYEDLEKEVWMEFLLVIVFNNFLTM